MLNKTKNWNSDSVLCAFVTYVFKNTLLGISYILGEGGITVRTKPKASFTLGWFPGILAL